jgi:hypothetical protein
MAVREGTRAEATRGRAFDEATPVRAEGSGARDELPARKYRPRTTTKALTQRANVILSSSAQACQTTTRFDYTFVARPPSHLPRRLAARRPRTSSRAFANPGVSRDAF